MPVEREFWWLPRPSKSKYPGSFPLHFEKKLCELLGIDPTKDKILHPFGGCAEFGDTVELAMRRQYFEERCEPRYFPDFFGNAHDLTNLREVKLQGGSSRAVSIADASYDLVVCDPHYTPEEGRKLYGIDPKMHPLRRSVWQAEAVRVTKLGGFVALYHRLVLPRPKGCEWKYLIAVATRVNHEGRFCGVFRKEG